MIKIRPATAITIFTLAGGLASGLAIYALNKRVKDAEWVSRSSVIAAAIISFGFTFGAAFLVSKIAEEPVETAFDEKHLNSREIYPY